MVGSSVFLGKAVSLNRAIVQGEGTVMRMKAASLCNHIKRDGSLPDLLRRNMHSLLAQVSQTAVCNRFHTVDVRLILGFCLWASQHFVWPDPFDQVRS